jgi:septal ring factor EnvC (AmiA/AmiB activator)
MSGADITTLIFQVIIAVIGASAAFVAIIVAKRGKEREETQKAIADAEARDQADRVQRFEELKTSLQAARTDLAYFREQVTAAREELTRVTADRDERIRDLEKRVKGLEVDKDEAFQQSDLLSEQLAEEREANKLLRSQLAATLAELDAAKQQIQNSAKQVVILTEHAKRVDDWWHIYVRLNGNPEGAPPPPKLTPFDAD